MGGGCTCPDLLASYNYDSNTCLCSDGTSSDGNPCDTHGSCLSRGQLENVGGSCYDCAVGMFIFFMEGQDSTVLLITGIKQELQAMDLEGVFALILLLFMMRL